MSWPLVRLGDCARIVGGATPSIDQTEFWGGSISWATPADLSRLDQATIANTPRTITKKGLASCATELLPPGSVLFSSRAPIGHVAINTVPMATNQGFKSFIPDRTRLLSGYLYFWLKSNRSYLESLGNGATFKEVSKEVVSRIVIPLPPLDEQRRTATILDQADDLRRKRRATLDLFEKLSWATFSAMFGDPEHNPRDFPNISFGDVIETGPTNGLYKPADAYGAGTPILRISNFYDGRVIDLPGLRRLRLSEKEVSAFSLRPDDIVINRVNSKEYLGKSALVPALDEATVFESNMMRIGLRCERIEPRYCIALLQTAFIRKQIASRTKDAVNQSSINQADVRSFSLPLPPIDLQRAFAARVAEIDALKATHRAHLAKLDALFASLQHRAFRGEL